VGRSHQEGQEWKNERSCPVKASSREVAVGFNQLSCSIENERRSGLRSWTRVW
jgi:hypothetical protein